MNTLLSKYFQEFFQQLNENDALYPREIEGLKGSLAGFFSANLLLHYIKKQSGKKVIFSDLIAIVPTEKDAMDFSTDLRAAGIEDIRYLPWWGMVPYRSVAKGALVFGERAAALSELASTRKGKNANSKPRVFVISQRAALSPVPPLEYMEQLLFNIEKKQSFDSVELANRLVVQGYIRVPRVTVRGEFALRGEVLDIFMPGEELAHRIVFDFDEIAQIKKFDTETQKSCGEVDSLQIYPMKEIVWDDKLVSQLEENLEQHQILKDNIEELRENLLSQLLINKCCEGEELFYPLVFKEKNCVLNYIDKNIPIVFLDYDRQSNALENLQREFSGMYKRTLAEKIVPPPSDLLLPYNDLLEAHEKRILVRSIHGNEVTAASRLIVDSEAGQSFFGNINYLKESLTDLFKDNWRVIIYAESENQSLRIKEILKEFSDNELLTVLPLGISSGFKLPEIKLLVIHENEIFGRRKATPRSVKQAKSSVIDTFVELNPGDFVVHVNYGIGLFKGIERVKTLGNERDYIKLLYADDDTVFIPIEQVNLVQRYIGNEGNAPRLDRLGSKTWENRKNKAKKSVEDIAQKLIDLYSRRKAARGFPFPKDGEWQVAFEAAFPYTETDDQLTVASEIKADMEKPIPMDRLVCGDVGYGKTEMAMRAAFKAVMGGKQVAFLAPTTILAEQHYENCVERFEKFPVRIAQMSRFVSKGEQKKILEKLATGEIDILVGTHRIIQKDVIFKDLGLLIIDEEQRFGVKDKERLKQLKTNIDCLAMSATPIPRTLHMSLLKIRDMSLLTTPPQNRHAIETVIDEYNDDRVAAAIRREAERGGQVFYLHNRVESLEEVKAKLQKIVPEMLVDVAHGQMSVTELDDIFRRFKMGGFHILVATTIIENGIDIPNVNTIIIDRADMYGVSQLYQLRGRVGRSDRKAYAYLLYPQGKSLTEIAMKRLQVISDFTELGSGFKIAMKDMEIRGAGNLLGKDQSGEVYSVGFDLYLRLLEDAIRRLSDENYVAENEVLLELEYTGFIPETYIINPQIKMEIYKKIAAVSTIEEHDRVYMELLDRFGPLPDEVASLLSLAQIRITCKKLNISSLKEKGGQVQVEFARVSEISIDKVLRLIKSSSGTVKLNSQKPNVLILSTGKIGLKEKSEYIKEKLEALA